MFATGNPARHTVVELPDQRAPLALNREPACTSHGCFSTLPACGVLLGQPLESETHDRAGIKTPRGPLARCNYRSYRNER
jgi:hypothetical protein